ncbi:hypothetical protein M9H77_31300 [Catharanthus roseus]|uniref:Uncharacterized protein n=1 Tax=Catharanthus roseus TaxID=4058 RepID=A0ACC0A3Y8_CATRO|nr:hypothetical protein M9H77_31300 [Catharanthus roseus]
MASSSSSNTEKFILKSRDGKTFEIDESVAKQSRTIKYMIEELYVGSGPILIPTVLPEILTKTIGYCISVICSATFDEDEAELKSFLNELVNDHETTLFGLLFIANYLTCLLHFWVQGDCFLSIACKWRLQSIITSTKLYSPLATVNEPGNFIRCSNNVGFMLIEIRCLREKHRFDNRSNCDVMAYKKLTRLDRARRLTDECSSRSTFHSRNLLEMVSLGTYLAFTPSWDHQRKLGIATLFVQF